MSGRMVRWLLELAALAFAFAAGASTQDAMFFLFIVAIWVALGAVDSGAGEQAP